MGWIRTFLLGDIGNRLDIADTERNIRDLRESWSEQFRTDDAQDREIERLSKDVDELRLLLVALTRSMARNGLLSEDELAEIASLDQADPDGPERSS